MKRNDCINNIAKNFSMDPAEVAGIYDEVMAEVRSAFEADGTKLSGWDMEAEFLRRADPRLKQEMAIRTKEAFAKKKQRITARKLLTHSAAVNSEAKILENLVQAEVLGRMKGDGGWYKEWGNTDPVQMMKALILGDGSGLPGTRESVSRMREGFDKADTAPLKEFMLKNPDIRKKFMSPFGSFSAKTRQVARKELRAMNLEIIDALMNRTELKDPKMNELAGILRDMTDGSTGRLIEKGAIISKMENYVPMSPSVNKIASTTREDFIQKMLDSKIVDWDTSFYDLPKGHLARAKNATKEVIAARTEILGDMYDIYAGRKEAETPELGKTKKGDSLVRRFEKQMQLRFVDAEAWIKFHEDFGNHSDVLAILNEKVQWQNRTAAVMSAFGPEPEKGMEIVAKRLINRIERGEIKLSEGNKQKVLDQLNAVKMVDGQRNVRDIEIKDLKSASHFVRTITSPEDGGLSMAFSEVSGETLYGVNHLAASWCSRTRVMKNMACLGRAVITAMTDVPNVLFSNVALGRSWGDSVQAYIKSYKMVSGMGGDDFDVIRPYISMFSDRLLGHYNSRFTLEEPGFGSRLQSSYFLVNGLTQWTDRQRMVAATMNMNWIGENAAHSWEKLSTTASGRRLLEVMKSQGVGPGRWDVVRDCLWTDPDGRPHFVPGLIDHIPRERIEAAINSEAYPLDMPWNVRRDFEARMDAYRKDPERFRRDLRSDMIALLNDETRYGVIESDDRVRHFSVRGTSPGTVGGEVLRFMSQYRSYGLGLADRTFQRAMFSGEGGKHSRWLPNSATVDMNVAKWIGMSIGMGYITQAASDISKGYAPRDMTGEHGWQTFLSAVEKSGAGAIYGDVIFDMLSGYDQSWIHKLVGVGLGPVGSTGLELAETLMATDEPLPFIWQGLKSGDKRFSRLFKFMINNCPYSNIFYARPVLDATILHTVEDMLSPGTVDRRKLWNKENIGREPIF